MLLVDEDWSKADPAGLLAAGYHAIIGYVSEDATGKNLTAADVHAAHRVGMAVGLVYEYATNAALGGAARGTRDAGIAVAHAQQLGAPAGVCLYHAVDFQAAAGDMPAILQYALAGQQVCAAAGYRHGIYADYAVCAYLRAHGYTGFLWQTYAWSLGQWFAAAVLRQELNHITIAGAVVDKDEALVDDWGQWEAEMSGLEGLQAAQLTNTSAIVYEAVALGHKAMAQQLRLGATGEQAVDGQVLQLVVDFYAMKAKIDAMVAPAPATVDTHTLAADLVTELEAAGILTADGAHTVLKQVLDAKFGAAAAA